MRDAPKFEIFLGAPPGLELALKAEALERGFAKAKAVPGGVSFRGKWPDVWRANLELRGASRVLARIGRFQVMHLSQLDKLARAFNWGAVLRADVPVKVDATCRASRIYHEGAVVQRVERALSEDFGAEIGGEEAIRLSVRIEDNQCTISVDSSGTLLHKRGYKAAVSKAPLRETMAALFLRQCGYHGQMPVLDPMCGSGTIVIEAAEMARGLAPGRNRHFNFERLATFDEEEWVKLREGLPEKTPDFQIFGSDRDAGAIKSATANAASAGVGDLTMFSQQSIGDLQRPDGPPGLVLTNPPYGARIGDKKQLFGLYGALGRVMRERYEGWKVGIITSDAGLAKATQLPFEPVGPPVAHGGLSVKLWQTGPLTM